MEKKSQKERISFSDIFDKGFKEILASQIITVGGGLAAGILLAPYTKKLLLIPGILILLPGFLEMRGSISGSFASRISSGLFLGVINPKLTKITKLIRGNIIASFWLTSVGALVLG
ncbi:MAG: divalent cation transporter, partial [Nanoarchaeota archaeon]